MGGDNNDNLQSLGWNAHRHLSSPIAQPRYRFQDVEKCKKSLEGSVVQEIPNTREAFKEIMAEMVLLCTEAIKRSRSGRTAGKPLSLEYIADRLDVDDPCFGYMIRSEQGHLQGFITVTTFTNWQKSFSWDSLQEMSFYYDDACDGDINVSKEVSGRIGKGSDSKNNQPLAVTPTKTAEDASYNNNNNNNNNKSNRNRNRKKKKKNLLRTPRSGEETPNNRGARQNRRKRVIDEDGSLAKALEKTVRLGDPYNEGIVWPRIAEISLLGALGCGKVLVQLVIEQLEFQRATGSANYDYIALQATDNSIPFYESLGFVRVGAVCYDMKQEQEDEDIENNRPSSPGSGTSLDKKGTQLIMPKTIVSSPNFVHEVARAGATPNDIAKRFKVCVWDIIFLNKEIYPQLKPTSRIKKGTQLYVPKTEDEENPQESLNRNDEERKCSSPGPESPTKWFVAKENDTPRKIAKQFDIACNKLVLGNRRRLPELQATSRLRAGTRVKISNLDQQDKFCEPYCHWSFPEDTAVEGGDPSYMMVYKLDRKTARNPRTVRDSLAVPVGKYSPPKLLFPAPPKNEPLPRSTDTPTETLPALPRLRKSPLRSTRASKGVFELKLPKQPKSPEELKNTPPEDGKQIYWDHQKELHPELSKSTPENEKIIKDRWSRLGNHKKQRYHGVAAEAQKIYKQIEREYKGEMSAWKKECDKIKEEHELEVQRKQAETAASRDKENSLFNKVIKLREDALEGKDYKYWFVLTFIPDLKWCHLAPMVQEGHFGPDRKRSYGRPRYRLVDEKLGKELDISSSFCIPVKSKALKRTADADKEEWDIVDGRVELVKEDVDTDATSIHSENTITIGSTRKTLSKQPKFRARTPVKPLNGKIAIGTTARYSQDPLKRTRASPSSGRKRRVEEILLAEKAAASKMASPVRERKRRRCMRCIENGASPSQAVGCLGAKGRFGRDACEFFDANGATKERAETKVPTSDGATKEGPKIRSNVDANFEKIEVTLTPSSPRRRARRPDASGSTPASPMHPAWSSSTKSNVENNLDGSADENKDETDTYEHSPRKSRRLV
eukprot:CAMPEP_0172385816 /NCGR_PEP_ID=MMETSP1061-20121228/3429_1 /TAXON_ID=37318 /ORGANISM="Pseudo-nitzschia pungens, Strain cf. pungens" /LENGTH=1063 /DNA_ID=CAMNT_0013114967 /DNA_START=242 /DNA_END=3433 /DNA_ORIENTATION=-